MPKITLYRGVRNRYEMDSILQNRTAGGLPQGKETKIPHFSEKVLSDMKGNRESLSADPDKRIVQEIVEYTSLNPEECNNPTIRGLARRGKGGIVLIEIDAAYVQDADKGKGECGYFIYSDTPCTVLAVNRHDGHSFTGWEKIGG